MLQDNLGPRIEAVLSAYKRSIGGCDVGVPWELLKTATPLREERVAGVNMGPGDIACDDGLDFEQGDQESGFILGAGADFPGSVASMEEWGHGSDLGMPGTSGKPSDSAESPFSIGRAGSGSDRGMPFSYGAPRSSGRPAGVEEGARGGEGGAGTGTKAFQARQEVDSGCVIMDTGVEDLTPLQIWSLALKSTRSWRTAKKFCSIRVVLRRREHRL